LRGLLHLRGLLAVRGGGVEEWEAPDEVWIDGVVDGGRKAEGWIVSFLLY
jgi:hypothetical protein